MMERTLFKPRTKRPPKAKGKKLNASQRSLAWLRKRGWTAERCEQYIPSPEGAAQKAAFAGGFRKDLFGMGDILAYAPELLIAGSQAFVACLLVQTTSRQQMAAHIRKWRADAKTRANILAWLACEYRALCIHGWEPVELPTKAGGVKVRWELTERYVTAADMEGEQT